MSNSGNQVLNSWKDIANYLQVAVRTAQVWEAQRGLPVRRVPGGRGLVWADPAELDAWRKSGRGVGLAGPELAHTEFANTPLANTVPANTAPAKPAPATATAASPTRHRTILLPILATVCLALSGWVVLSRSKTEQGTARSVLLATSPGDEWEATFSPDGTRVAYIWNGDTRREPYNLYIKAVAGGPPRRLTNGPWREQHPQWSPDGQWIAVGRVSDSTVEILLISPDGDRQRTLAQLESPSYRDATAVGWVSWIPGSKSVAIIERPSLDDPFSVFRLSIETGERKQLTFPPRGTVGDLQCAFSPDGRYMALVRYHDGATSDLYLLSLDGREPRRLTRDRIYHSGLTWTPDSREVIYGAQRQSQSWALWRIAVAAFGKTPPVRIAGVQEDASWPTVAMAPAGDAVRIAYTQSRSTANVYRWDKLQMPDSAPQTVCPSTRSEKAVKYSPDGGKIAFVSTREGSREIWVCDADGSRPTRITSLKGEYTDSPRWSPDGQRLAFTTSFAENRDVWIADLGTGRLERFTQEPSHEGRPAWSSDGRWIYFRSNRSGREEIWKMPVAGGEPAVQVTTSGAFEAFEALDGSRLYFTKDRPQRGVWSVPTTGGDETFVVEDVREGLWSVAVDGIYYISHGEIRSYQFDTHKVEPVARIPGSPQFWTGFSVRSDGQSFLWCQTTRNDNDIMMLEVPLP